jgi:hypothetical protein
MLTGGLLPVPPPAHRGVTSIVSITGMLSAEARRTT